ncbi:uncharacterized protein V1510DRAFT_431924 [Dipodascopsis tothii]|uniref:uncharacterized protein n=1 Tax=Dipodascopsis tothii TaxID=44089 RepID=UPI0034CECCF3
MAGPTEDVFCTLLLTDSYLPGALTLATALAAVSPAYKRAVLVTPGLSTATLDALQTSYDYVIDVAAISNAAPANLFLLGRPDLLYTFTKVALWRQTQFRRIVFLDADTLPVRPLDELFAVPAPFAAAPDAGWPDIFNSGVLVLSPDQAVYDELFQLADAGTSFDGGDQGLLNAHFRDWHRLPFAYNVTPSAGYQYVPAYRHFAADIRLIHFIGAAKPWHSRTPPSDPHGVYGDMLARWWAVHDTYVSPIPPTALAHAPDSTSSTGQSPPAVPAEAQRAEPGPQHAADAGAGPEIPFSTQSALAADREAAARDLDAAARAADAAWRAEVDAANAARAARVAERARARAEADWLRGEREAWLRREAEARAEAEAQAAAQAAAQAEAAEAERHAEAARAEAARQAASREAWLRGEREAWLRAEAEARDEAAKAEARQQEARLADLRAAADREAWLRAEAEARAAEARVAELRAAEARAEADRQAAEAKAEADREAWYHGEREAWLRAEAEARDAAARAAEEAARQEWYRGEREAWLKAEAAARAAEARAAEIRAAEAREAEQRAEQARAAEAKADADREAWYRGEHEAWLRAEAEARAATARAADEAARQEWYRGEREAWLKAEAEARAAQAAEAAAAAAAAEALEAAQAEALQAHDRAQWLRAEAAARQAADDQAEAEREEWYRAEREAWVRAEAQARSDAGLDESPDAATVVAEPAASAEPAADADTAASVVLAAPVALYASPVPASRSPSPAPAPAPASPFVLSFDVIADWDPARQSPPPKALGEGATLPESLHYDNTWDRAEDEPPFVYSAPASAPATPAPEARARPEPPRAPSPPPPAIFPWEAHQLVPVRTFPEDVARQAALREYEQQLASAEREPSPGPAAAADVDSLVDAVAAASIAAYPFLAPDKEEAENVAEEQEEDLMEDELLSRHDYSLHKQESDDDGDDEDADGRASYNAWDRDPNIVNYVSRLASEYNTKLNFSFNTTTPVTPALVRRREFFQQGAPPAGEPDVAWDPNQKLDELAALPAILLARHMQEMQAAAAVAEEEAV